MHGTGARPGTGRQDLQEPVVETADSNPRLPAWRRSNSRTSGAIVSGGGRPDLAAGALERVTAPTLLIVGGRDPQGLELNREAPRAMPCETRLEIVPGGHPPVRGAGGQLEREADLATEWFGAIWEGKGRGPNRVA
jgi:pimeloyl-ACP methyl ester carboxylesterase